MLGMSESKSFNFYLCLHTSRKWKQATYNSVLSSNCFETEFIFTKTLAFFSLVVEPPILKIVVKLDHLPHVGMTIKILETTA